MRSLRIGVGAVVFVAALLSLVYWVEAEKEGRILCGLSRPGTSSAEVDRLFGTATLLRVTRDSAGARATLRAASPHNLWLTGCTMVLQDGSVREARYRERFALGAFTIGRLLGPDAGGALASIAEGLVGLLVLLSLAWGFTRLAREEARGRWTRVCVALLLACAGVVLLLG